MKNENMMRPFDPDEVEPEEAIRMAREKERAEEEAHRARLQEASREQERDPIRELDQLLEEMQAGMEKTKRKCMKKCVVFGGAAVIVLGAMVYGWVNPMFALPLTAVYLMRAAVQYDRGARI